MGMDDILAKARDAVRRIVPDHVEITKIEYEGPVVAIYTKNMEAFSESNDLVRQIAQTLRKRITIRPDPSLLAPTEKAEEIIRELIPKDAQLTNIFFESETGEVTIEALAPGMVIGKQGALLNELKKKIGWAPKVAPTPPIPSKTVEEVRAYLRSVRDEREAFLKNLARRLCREVQSGENWVRVTALGGFRQVGRSASLITPREPKAPVDCGAPIS